jgi:hypothetical protein
VQKISLRDKKYIFDYYKFIKPRHNEHYALKRLLGSGITDSRSCIVVKKTIYHVSSKGGLNTTKHFNVRTSMIKRMERVVKKDNKKFYL